MTAAPPISIGDFEIADAEVDLPRGAFAGGRRRLLRHAGAPVLAMTEGRFRSCLHPVWTPAGAVVTAEAPADHPHHTGIWCAADHVHVLMPTAAGHEVYTYNLYVEDVFQGRAPGTIREHGFAAEAAGSDRIRLRQEIEWRGPREWAAPDGRLIFTEAREIVVAVTPAAHVVDMVSELRTPEFAVELGPTRHGYFNARISEGISLAAPGGATCSRGLSGGDAITGTATAAATGGSALWVDWSGPAGHGAEAGLAVLPAAGSTGWWFVTDWGVMTTGPFRHEPLRIGPGEAHRFACRFVAHDGAAAEAGLAGHYRDFVG